MKSRRQQLECRICGIPSHYDGYLSFTGQCPECGEWGLVYNMRGLADKSSVPYKVYKVAHDLKPGGRPPICTPPPSWIPKSSLH